jgi:phosphoglycolate phosphatase
MNTQTTKALIFDLDGTLLNTIDDLADSINVSMKHFSYPTHSKEEYKLMIGAGARDHIQKAMPSPQSANEELVDLAFHFYKQTYAKSWQRQTGLYTGIAELLDGLTLQGLPYSIFTNKPHEFTLEMTKHYLSSWPFHTILGAGDNFPRKPSPEGALFIAKEMKCEPHKILFIGDSDLDILTAKAAGMKSVGVTWGFRPQQELVEAGADYIIHHPRELLEIIEKGTHYGRYGQYDRSSNLDGNK